MNKSDKRLALLKQGDEAVIRDVYQEFRPGFLLFAKRYDLDGDTILDVYQDAIMALCENAKKGNLDSLSSSLKTYLFSIGKYMIYDRLRKEKKQVIFENIENFHFEWEEYSDESNNEEIKQLQASFSKMGSKCREILLLFYYEERTLDEITELMEYENKDVAKSQKSRCIKSLKELIKTGRNGQ